MVKWNEETLEIHRREALQRFTTSYNIPELELGQIIRHKNVLKTKGMVSAPQLWKHYRYDAMSRAQNKLAIIGLIVK